MAPAIIGLNGMTRTARVKNWDRVRGQGYVETWKGPLAEAEAKYLGQILNDDIDLTDYERRSGVGTVVIKVFDDDGEGGGQTSEELNAKWEVGAQELFKSVRAHEDLNKAADQANMELTREAFEKADSAFTPTGAAATTYFNMLRRGQSEYVRTIPILTKSLAVGNRSVASASWIGVDEAWQIDGETGSPNPPTEIIGVIDDHPEHDPTKKQWLKKGPRVVQTTPLTFNIIYIWWFSRQWSETTYHGDTDADNP